MFYLFENGKYKGDCNVKMTQKDCETIEIDFTQEELKKLKNGCLYENGNIIETQEYFDYLKNQQIQTIQNDFQNTIKQFSSDYSQVEIDSWETKTKEAEKVIAGETSVFLNALVIEGETVVELANKILTNADNYSLAYAQAEKVMREQIQALETN